MTEKEVKKHAPTDEEEYDEEEWPDEEEIENNTTRESRKTDRQNGRTKSFRKPQKEFNTHKENDYNDCRFQGRLGRDPEIAVTANGKPYAKFSLAVWQGKEKDSMWLNCVAWEGLAEFIDTKFGKGDEVRVAGRFGQRKYEGKYYNDLTIDFIEKVER